MAAAAVPGDGEDDEKGEELEGSYEIAMARQDEAIDINEAGEKHCGI